MNTTERSRSGVWMAELSRDAQLYCVQVIQHNLSARNISVYDTGQSGRSGCRTRKGDRLG
jgi:hypothetical protein